MKPIVFFSHASRDQESLLRLKELFVEKTGGTIDVFLSSDGQSIPFGRNWVHRVQEAMENARIMIVFVSPNALRSHWLFFEAGFTYSKGIRVVPVGFLGVDLGTLPPPLGLLQGFNIKSEESLNNLIAIANDTFDFKHTQSFTSEEYQDIIGQTAGGATSIYFGAHAHLIESVTFTLHQHRDFLDNPAGRMDKIAEILSENDIEYASAQQDLYFHGVSIHYDQGSRFEKESFVEYTGLIFTVDAGLADVSFPILETIFKAVRKDGIPGLTFRFMFISSVGSLHVRKDWHRISARVYETEARFAQDRWFVFQDIEFLLGNNPYEGRSLLDIRFKSDTMPAAQIRDVMNLLVEKEILFDNPNYGS